MYIDARAASVFGPETTWR